MKWAQKQKGFTIVELLIVVVVIAILAAITIAAYTGIQASARDSARSNDVASIAKALELYYLDKGMYPGTPTETGGSTSINSGWSTTADGSWQALLNALAPYAKGLGKDPISTPGSSVVSGGGYNYAYFASATAYCGAGPFQMYILVYRFEDSPRKDTLNGDCPASPLYYPLASNYRVVK